MDEKTRQSSTHLTFFLDEELYGLNIQMVREVLDISPEQIDAAPRLGSRVDTRFIAGIGKLADGFVILLNIDEIFSDRELSMIAGMRQQVEDQEE